MPEQSYAQVVFSLPLDRAYTYSIPDELRDSVKLGVRVTVPLRKQVSTGYVVGISAEAPDREIKPLCDVLDPEPLFDDNLLKLTRWIADYYLCSWGQALDCALPPGVRLAAESHIALVPHMVADVNGILAELRRSAARQHAILKFIVAEKRASIARLQKKIGADGLYGSIAALEKRGVITREAVIKSGARPRQMSAVRVVPDIDADAAIADIAGSAPKQAAILGLLRERGEMLAGELTKATGSSYAAIHALEKKGLIELFTKEVLRGYPEDYIEEEAGIRHILTEEQRVSLNLINAYVESGEFKTILLEGVTGSGKTEVYLQAIELALKRGKGAIVLVPEIALTPQTVARFRARFGDSVAVMHSRLSAGERYDEWRQIRSGFYNIVVGARSAVFAPVRNLGLIVVDEEHEGSYKQGETPRYHGRDVAIMRGRDAGAAVILGTATPSLETYYNVEVGKYERTELSARVMSQPLPEVRLVDLREANRGQTVETILSDELCFKIEEKLGRGEQVIIFLNRRGYTPFFLCPKCGVPVGCPHCSVALTYHAAENRMKCHYCGSTRQVAEQCPYCGNTKLAKFGTGTERVEEELENTFPKARIRRMDADTTSTKGAHAKILQAFRSGDVDILVGTQMLAKGLDFPRVTLVGVVLADVAINLPDFRAAERTFQLLMQVSGRSGRSHLGGEVIIQAYNPNHYAVQAARKHDLIEFYHAEMKHRRKSEFPPYRHLMNVLIDSTSQKDGQQVVRALALKPKELEQNDAGRMLKVLGPAPAPMAKIKGRYRFRFLMLSSDTVLLRSLGREIIDSHRRLRGTRTRLTVDMDALSML
jgi:primosomal protein N' (replication factor Y)